MLSHPEDRLCVAAVPRGSLVHTKETPRVVVVLSGHQDAYAVLLQFHGGHVLLPNDAEEQRTGVVHDRHVGNIPVAVVLVQVVKNVLEERVAGDTAHRIVRDSGRDGLPEPGMV